MRSPPATDLVRGGAGQLEEEDEEFYETLDRILSSSSSSTSASVSDDDSSSTSVAHHHGHRGQRRREPPPPLLIPAPSFSAATNFDLWLRIPSSVEERRRCLLRQLGLADDPALSRHRPNTAPDPPPPPVTNAAGVGGSAPDPAVQTGPAPSPPGLGARPAESPAYPPHDPQGQAECSSPAAPRTPAPDCEDDSASESGRETHGVDQYCTIKNLDSGEKFVVKGVREDGMWDELREVGTGRQLTMEEFQTTVIGHSPIVQELLRRESRESAGSAGGKKEGSKGGRKRSGGWFRSIRSMASTVVPSPRGDRRSSDERDTSSEKGGGGGGGRRSSSATDDSQAEGHAHHLATERVRVRQYGKSCKELTGLYRNQVIYAHSGSIWTMKFSLDGRYLASAGEDCDIHVWQVVESDRRLDMTAEDAPLSSPFALASLGSPEPTLLLEGSNLEKRRRARASGFRKSFSSLDHVVIPEKVFALSEKPVCFFHGHTKDVLDLSWSKSQRLLSSSMDKTVRLWDLCSKTCLKAFSHSDYVTCIQFNPIDDNYFISGSLDDKVRLWNIEKRQVVDWIDLHEMVTAACYTPDGQGAFIGTHKGSCLFYNTSDNKLQKKGNISLQIRRKRSHLRKITGFQFAPGSLKELFVTSADSRIRVVDDLKLVHRFKGFRNKTSQISASLTADGEHVICASEDSHVYIWNYNANSQPSRNLGTATVSQSYEQFHCRSVSVALAWPANCVDKVQQSNSFCQDGSDLSFSSLLHALPNGANESSTRSLDSGVAPANGNHFSDRASATWPEEQLCTTAYKQIPPTTGESNCQVQSVSAWGMVIVTAGHDGEIKVYQNFGYPVRA